MIKILITGAKGQLGNSLREKSGEFKNLEILFTDLDELDILDEKQVAAFLSREKPSLLINCAAYTAVDKAEDHPDDAKKLNSTAPGILAEKLSEMGGKLIHLSTDYVFDGKKGSEYFEDDPVNPTSVYGKTKANGERKVLAFPGNVVVRTSWLYSIYGNNFFKTMVRLMGERDEIKVVNDQFGSPTYAPDLAESILTMTEKLSSTVNYGGIYHYSNKGEINWFQFAEEIRKLLKSPCKVIGIPSSEYPAPAPRPVYGVMNKEKIENTFDLSIPGWKDSLKLCYENYMKI